jgi:hypothetical protein
LSTEQEEIRCLDRCARIATVAEKERMSMEVQAERRSREEQEARRERERRMAERNARGAEEVRRHEERRAARAAEAEAIRLEEEESLVRFTERCRVHEDNMAERAAEIQEIRQEEEESHIRFLETKRKAAEEVRPPVIPKAKWLIITRNKGKADEVVSKVQVGRRKPVQAPESIAHPANGVRTLSTPEALVHSASPSTRSDVPPCKPKLTIRRGPDHAVPAQSDMSAILAAALNPPPITYNPPTRYGRFAKDASTLSAPSARSRYTSKASTLSASEDTAHSSCLKPVGSKKQKSVQFAERLETISRFVPDNSNNDLLYTQHEDRLAKRPVQWVTGSHEAPSLESPHDTMWEKKPTFVVCDELPVEAPMMKEVTSFRNGSQRHRVDQVREFYVVQALEQTAYPGRYVEVKQKFPGFYGTKPTRYSTGVKRPFTGVLLEDSFPLKGQFHPKSFGEIVFKDGKAAFLSEPYQVNEGIPGAFSKYQCEKGGSCLKFSHALRCGCECAWNRWFGPPGNIKPYRIQHPKGDMATKSLGRSQ